MKMAQVKMKMAQAKMKTVKNKLITIYLNILNLKRRNIMCFSGTSDRW